MATRFFCISLCAIGIAVPALAAEPKESSPAPTRYEISAIRTRAFFHESGRFDDRELQDPKLALWNVGIGEGDAGENISNTLVLVDVAGPSFLSGVRGSIELVARAKDYDVVKSTVPLHDLFTEHHEVTAPFLVYGIECGDMTLTARVRVDGKVVAEKTGVVPFRCGE